MAKTLSAGRHRDRSRRLAALVILAASVGLAGAGQADEARWTWFQQDDATGDWGGLRTELTDAGIAPNLSYSADFLADPVGGERQGSAYAAGLYGSLELDFDTLFGLEGSSLFASAIWDQGNDLSAQDIGNVFTVANNFNGRSLRLAQFYLQQQVWEGRVEAAAGRLAAGDDFAASDLYDYYVSAAINSNPQSLAQNSAFTVAPFVQWGARVAVEPVERGSIKLGVYVKNPSTENLNGDGEDFAFRLSNGVLGIVEIGFEKPAEPLLGDLPGHLAVGGFYNTGDFALVDQGSGEERGNYSLYLTAEQTLFREPGSRTQGLTAWTAVTVAPKQAINTLPFAAYGGVLYTGLLPGRDQDVTAFGLYYGSFSDRLEDQSFELVLEANHRFQMAPWLYLTPDVQYVVNPNGGGIPDALVVGAELGITF